MGKADRPRGEPANLPTGIVSFLFTDIVGSTKRWEANPDQMRADLAEHDEVFRELIDSVGGYFYQHTGDGIVAAFHKAVDAVRVAVDAQRRLKLPSRMGVGTGDAAPDGGDYWGPILNRTARVMSAGHGGQILIEEHTAHLIDDLSDSVSLIDLGRRRLRDLATPVHIFQVEADGLRTSFAPLKTVDVVPGNLPAPATSFIGRDKEIRDLRELLRSRRLVTLTGVGGVGKTRLALQAAADATDEFVDGVWLAELASVADPEALPDVVANALEITAQRNLTLVQTLVKTLADRRMLLVLDNCEHVLDAAAELVESLLAGARTLVILATSREGLGVDGEHGWPVPPLDTAGGRASAAATLFAERAATVNPSFSIDDAQTSDVVAEICEQLDGIALAIELAAARMVAMSAREVRDRLDDRFRLLSGGRRRLPRHQTLLQAVRWSYDLLSPDEQALLISCSVFFDGFGLEAICHVHDLDDEYVVLDLMDSLVRKSLVTTEQHAGRTRYHMLETIRQFGYGQLKSEHRLEGAQQAHARFFADEVMRYWPVWDGPEQLQALNWIDAELSNLRAAFRFAAGTGDLVTATRIAAHASLMNWPLQRFEPVTWAEEILPSAVQHRVAELPRLYIAASLCLYFGRPDLGVTYAQEAARLEREEDFDPLVNGWSGLLEALSHLFAGRVQRRVEVCQEMVTRTGFARVVGMCGLTWALPAVGRSSEAEQVADETLVLARAFGNPFWIGWAYGGVGRAFADSAPERALGALRAGLRYAEDQRLAFWVANLAQDAAKLEATHGVFEDAMDLFRRSIDGFQRAGNVVFVAAAMASLAVCLARRGSLEAAARVYGSSTRQASISLVPTLTETIDRVRAELGEERFDALVAQGAALSLAESVTNAHLEISNALARYSATAP